jgi:hypothetical protein
MVAEEIALLGQADKAEVMAKEIVEMVGIKREEKEGMKGMKKFVLLSEPYKMSNIFFFCGALEPGEENKISPHKTSRPTLFKEITWCVLKLRDNVVFMQTSSSKAAVHAAVSILHVIMTLSLVFVRACVRVRECVRVRACVCV